MPVVPNKRAVAAHLIVLAFAITPAVAFSNQSFEERQATVINNKTKARLAEIERAKKSPQSKTKGTLPKKKNKPSAIEA